MKRILMISAAIALSCGAAYAMDSMAGVIGNTVVAKGPDGEVKMWYKADHTYSGTDSKGTKMSGSWEEKAGQVCLTQKDPAPAAGQGTHCGPSMEGKKAGDSWESTSADGKKYSVSIVKGM